MYLKHSLIFNNVSLEFKGIGKPLLLSFQSNTKIQFKNFDSFSVQGLIMQFLNNDSLSYITYENGRSVIFNDSCLHQVSLYADKIDKVDCSHISFKGSSLVMKEADD